METGMYNIVVMGNPQNALTDYYNGCIDENAFIYGPPDHETDYFTSLEDAQARAKIMIQDHPHLADYLAIVQTVWSPEV